MIALGIPLALAAGFLTDLVAGAVRARPLLALRLSRTSFERLLRREAVPSMLEVGGVVAALLGGGIVAWASVVGRPGSVALLYLALALGAMGAHAAAGEPPRDGHTDGEKPRGGEERRARRDRVVALASEPAFVVALGVAFLRWSAEDLDAVFGAHAVLGESFRVGPPFTLAGAMLAAAVVVVAGALRLPSAPAEDAGPGEVAALLARWAVAGATVLLVAGLVAGVGISGLPESSVWAGVAVAASLLLGVVRGVVRGHLARLVAASVLALAAAGAVVLVVVAGT